MKVSQVNEYGIGVIRCHWDKDFRCGVGRMCRGCEHQPEDDDKPNGKMPPVKLLWVPTLNAAGDAFIPDGEPKCPTCGEMPYSTDRCVFCGQKFLKEDTK